MLEKKIGRDYYFFLHFHYSIIAKYICTITHINFTKSGDPLMCLKSTERMTKGVEKLLP